MSEPPSHPAAHLGVDARYAFECIAFDRHGEPHPPGAIAALRAAGLIIRTFGGGWTVDDAAYLDFRAWCATQEPLDD